MTIDVGEQTPAGQTGLGSYGLASGCGGKLPHAVEGGRVEPTITTATWSRNLRSTASVCVERVDQWFLFPFDMVQEPQSVLPLDRDVHAGRGHRSLIAVSDLRTLSWVQGIDEGAEGRGANRASALERYVISKAVVRHTLGSYSRALIGLRRA
jgi:hypothetical protein